MTNENVIMKIQPNVGEYSSKMLFSMIPTLIGLIGIFIGIIALVSSQNPSETPISLCVLVVSGMIFFCYAVRIFAFYMKSNKAKNTLINVTKERIFGMNGNFRIDIDVSSIVSVTIVEGSVDVDSNGIPKSFKIDLTLKAWALISKYLNIRTNDGKNIYIDCIDSLEAVKNTIESIRLENMANRKDTV